MPLAKIEIEQIEGNRWVAEVEAGGFNIRRERVTAGSFDDVVSSVIDKYREMMPEDQKTPPYTPDRPLDEDLQQPKPPAPIGRRQAHRMRQRADDHTERADGHTDE
jgi:hypothetical protein